MSSSCSQDKELADIGEVNSVGFKTFPLSTLGGTRGLQALIRK
jgi:hypothetical protein